MCMPTGSNHSLKRSNSSSASPPLKQRPRVRFGAVCTREALEVHHLDEAQVEALWFSRPELRSIKRGNRRVTRDRDFRHDCIRGLEMCLDPQRSRNVESKILELLDAQYYNQRAGLKCDKHGLSLKSLALCLSSDDRKRGVLQATVDAMEANRIYKESGMDARTVDKCLE